MYTMEGRIRYSECGTDNRATLSAIVNYFQDCTTENSERLGVGNAYLKGQKRAWILNAWQIELRRRPKVGEQVRISTWATGFKGIFGPRDFSLETAEGEVLAFAHSLWVYVDTETGRPVKPEEKDISVYEVGEPLPIANFPRKIMLPEEAVAVDTFSVRKYHIDTNNHVNNSKYIELACEVLPNDFPVTTIRVEYKKAAVYGGKIVLKCAVQSGLVTVGLCDEEGRPYAVIEFRGDN